MSDYVKLTYVHSSVGNSYMQKRTIRALGFRRLHQSRIIQDSSTLRGMLRSVAHLVKVERCEAPTTPFETGK
jgi:large subunit ribosomal protein L30